MEHQDWLCNIINQHIKFHPSDDLQTFLTPLILIRQLTHYDSHTALRQVPTSHRVKSSDQVIFPFYLDFPMMSHCVSFITHFLFDYHLIRHAVLKRNFLEFSSDSLMSNRLLISECCLVILQYQIRVLHAEHYIS